MMRYTSPHTSGRAYNQQWTQQSPTRLQAGTSPVANGTQSYAPSFAPMQMSSSPSVQLGTTNGNSPMAAKFVSAVGSSGSFGNLASAGSSHGISSFLSGAAAQDLEDLDSKINIRQATCIGKGLYSEVILAHRSADSQQVAIKVVGVSAGTDSEHQIRKEVEALHNVGEHPNLVRILDVLKCTHALPSTSQRPPMVCLVMRYVGNACALSQRIQNGPSGEGVTANIGRDIASGLVHMHRCGYVHLDVWSENILVDGAGTAFLCDFGCAVRIGEPVRSDLNMPYMSPGAWNHLSPVPGDDCWALSLVLSEVLTGKLLMQRLGGDTARPVHSVAMVFSELQQETIQCSSIIGRLCEKVFGDMRTEMKEMYDTLSSVGSGVGSGARGFGGGASRGSLSRSRTGPGLGTTGTSSEAPLRVGLQICENARVEYCARSDRAWYPGCIVGRTPEQDGWLIQLDCGLMKTISDQEVSTRLRL